MCAKFAVAFTTSNVSRINGDARDGRNGFGGIHTLLHTVLILQSANKSCRHDSTVSLRGVLRTYFTYTTNTPSPIESSWAQSQTFGAGGAQGLCMRRFSTRRVRIRTSDAVDVRVITFTRLRTLFCRFRVQIIRTRIFL